VIDIMRCNFLPYEGTDPATGERRTVHGWYDERQRVLFLSPQAFEGLCVRYPGMYAPLTPLGVP
jgi:hypothetical protein